MQAALLMLLVLGFIALGVEASQLLLEHRKQQTVADSAAIAAAAAVKLGVADVQAEARAVTAQMGYRDGVGGVTVTAVKPPASGPHAGDVKYVEVRIGRSFTPALIQLFRSGPTTVRARAVASVGSAGSTVCALLLESSASEALKLSNNGKITLPSCAITVNSTSNSAVVMSNNTTIAGDLAVAGNTSMHNSASVTGAITRGATPGTNPYASVALPGSKGVQRTLNLQNNEKKTIDPGYYPNGWNFWGNQEITLNPGYYFVQSQLGVSNNVKVTGTNVVIVIDGTYAMNVSNHASLTLSGRSDLSGIAIYSNQSTAEQSFSNDVALNVTGALYFPKQKLKFSNNVATGASSCTQLIARSLDISNGVNLTLKGSCSGVGTSSLGASGPTALAE